ncbi:MAG: uracil-DNA glycosylase [Chloroflexota bacterium]|nr:uracil-DNA glycosylase [Chloroflexota bacterium]
MQEEDGTAANGPSRDEIAAQLAEIADEIRVCTKCELCKMRTKAVPGDGPVDAPILFIGEAPGFHEDQRGHPFIGAAGNLLNDLLASVGIERSQVFITNLVKCRPPGNRDPLPDEISTCTSNYLDRQIALINPRMIVAIGRFSMARYFPGEKIMKIHGQPKRADGRIYFPMVHPAAALHQPAFMEHVKEDIKKIPALLEEAKAMAAPENDGESPAQLSLF